MSKQTKIVDLEVSDDGTYEVKKSKPPKIVQKKEERKRVVNGADEFLGGLDMGLDFVEGLSSRVSRFMGLRD